MDILLPHQNHSPFRGLGGLAQKKLPDPSESFLTKKEYYYLAINCV
jgi:hypothetical protein